MKRVRTNQQGFTLIEVLIALVLMALLSIISWRALDLVERSSTHLNASADDTLALMRVLGQIESDISRHANADILFSPSTGLTANHASPSSPNSTMLPPGILWDEPVLTIVRSAYDGAWQKVAWGKDGDMLRRAVGPASSALPLPATGTGEVVLGQVKSFMVRAWVPGRGWSALNSTDSKFPATGLEIIIERLHNGVSEAYRKVVLLP